METGIHSEIASNDWIPACAGMDGVNTRRLYVLMKRATAIFAAASNLRFTEQEFYDFDDQLIVLYETKIPAEASVSAGI